MHWIDNIAGLKASKTPFVLVTVLKVTGSAPRGAGTRMVVTGSEVYATIGGGHLEYQVILQSRQRIEKRQHGSIIVSFQLGASLGQCCGGVVEVLLESWLPNVAPVVIFGAGHIGRALVRILEPLEIPIDWIDSRKNEFLKEVSSWIRILVSEDPLGEGAFVNQGAAVMIMTHSHSLDFDLCELFLKRTDLSYLGLIGSKTKRKTFENRLNQRGFSASELQRLQCPAGRQIGSKHPQAIAVSLAAEILPAVFMKEDSECVVEYDMVVK
ncbi:MAG: xanthine dehydrogenase accessory protein XdhC [Candidatus Cloacimonetes bacterium]|nr:xanthine dehydrogenase accessory protein XdhC [Candidatus Cloacimonadota bacterium]